MKSFFFKLVLRENFLKYNWYSIKKKKKGLGSLAVDTLSSIYLLIWIILKIQIILQKKKITNCWCDDWLLINEKVILMVCLDKTNKKLIISIFCKNIIK